MFRIYAVIIVILALGVLAINLAITSWKSYAENVTRMEKQADAEKVQRDVYLKRLEHKLELAEITLSTLLCESGMQHYGVKGDSGKAYGLLQIHEKTFYELAGKAGMKGLYWRNPYHQVQVFQWAVENGYGNKWTCYKEAA